jgi:hypothetical protein
MPYGPSGAMRPHHLQGPPAAAAAAGGYGAPRGVPGPDRNVRPRHSGGGMPVGAAGPAAGQAGFKPGWLVNRHVTVHAGTCHSTCWGCHVHCHTGLRPPCPACPFWLQRENNGGGGRGSNAMCVVCALTVMLWCHNHPAAGAKPGGYGYGGPQAGGYAPPGPAGYGNMAPGGMPPSNMMGGLPPGAMPPQAGFNPQQHMQRGGRGPPQGGYPQHPQQRR